MLESKDSLKPLFKYPGGKTSEYKYLKDFFPDFHTYIEPFVGGGAVYWKTDAESWIINDFSEELINIYKYTQKQNALFLEYMESIAKIWDNKWILMRQVSDAISLNLSNESFDADLLTFSNVLDRHSSTIFSLQDMDVSLRKAFSQKIKSLERISTYKKIENIDENALGVIGAGIYNYFRELYNTTSITNEPELKSALYLFLREFAYAGMFRYNAKGGFNVPFGGNSYAKKAFITRFNQLNDNRVIEKLSQTKIINSDFSDALIDETGAFIFLDPPYDSEFSTYNLHVFDANEQKRLKNQLKEIKKSKWLMVTKSTPFIEELYDEPGWYKNRFDKRYSVNIQNRNDQKVEHLIITNYQI